MESPALTTDVARPGSTMPAATKRFCLILIKPSHYDDDGYVVQWLRSTIPSNWLAALYGLARDCRQRHVLGDDVEIEIHPFDETNARIRPKELAAMICEAGDGMVMFVGVQSNQFPHMLDLAKPLLAHGIQIAVGGFHVSGTMSMLGGNDVDVHREKVKQGLRSFFITDDNFARNKDWEAILDRIIHLREVEKLKLGFLIQVDTLCHKLPNFIEKCARAGVRRVFIGLENINPDNLAAAHKRQNKITEYRKMLLAWKEAKIITYCGYITGFPNDTAESIKHDVEIVKKELPL